MSALYAFLHPAPIENTKEIVISDRFRDEEGNVVPFRIRTISQDENTALNRKAQKTDVIRGQKVQGYDNIKYSYLLVVACTVQPDFRDSELCRAYGTMDPQEVPGKMLTPGEFARLTDAIMDFNGFTEAAEAEEEEAKNF